MRSDDMDAHMRRLMREARKRIAELGQRSRKATLGPDREAHRSPQCDRGREVPARKLYSIAEAMQIFNRSRASIWRDIRDGRLRP